MGNEESVPETKGVTVELMATVDLGPEIEGMAGRQLRMRRVTIEPGGVFGPCTTTWAGRASSTSCRERSPTTGTGSPRTTGRAWAGPRTATPCTGWRTGGRFRRWRSPSISSDKSRPGPGLRLLTEIDGFRSSVWRLRDHWPVALLVLWRRSVIAWCRAHGRPCHLAPVLIRRWPCSRLRISSPALRIHQLVGW